MINIQNIGGYGIQDPGFELLRQVAQKYCPEELQDERKAVIPDEQLDLSSLAVLFNATESHPTGQGTSPIVPADNGFGIGIPETEKLQSLH